MFSRGIVSCLCIGSDIPLRPSFFLITPPAPVTAVMKRSRGGPEKYLRYVTAIQGVS